jgi:hypothetical protein
MKIQVAYNFASIEKASTKLHPIKPDPPVTRTREFIDGDLPSGHLERQEDGLIQIVILLPMFSGR